MQGKFLIVKVIFVSYEKCIIFVFSTDALLRGMYNSINFSHMFIHGFESFIILLGFWFITTF